MDTHFAFLTIQMGLSENVVYPEKPNGFADHYPYEKLLFHWGYIPHFQTYPNTSGRRGLDFQQQIATATVSPRMLHGCLCGSCLPVEPRKGSKQLPMDPHGISDGMVNIWLWRTKKWNILNEWNYQRKKSPRWAPFHKVVLILSLSVCEKVSRVRPTARVGSFPYQSAMMPWIAFNLDPFSIASNPEDKYVLVCPRPAYFDQ